MKLKKIEFGLGLLGLSSLAIALSGYFSASQSQLTANIKTTNFKPANITNQQIVATPPADISSPAQKSSVEKCSEAKTVPPSQKLKLRKCHSLDWREHKFILERDNKEIGSWNAKSSLRFDVFESDLDGDGRQELIVTDHNGTSNGLGVSYWTIYILPDPTYPLPTPMQFETQEYGKVGTFVPDGDRFEVWTTEWKWIGETTGIIGQQWRYRQGELIPTDHPILRRWLSFNFAAERSQTHRDPRVPYLWLANPKVQAYEENPLLQPYEITSIEDGIIQNIRNIRNISVDFQPDQGNPKSYYYHDYNSSDLSSISYFGDWSSHRIYPVRYLPSDPQKWLKDKRCKIITYRDKYSRTLRIIWITSNESL